MGRSYHRVAVGAPVVNVGREAPLQVLVNISHIDTSFIEAFTIDNWNSRSRPIWIGTNSSWYHPPLIEKKEDYEVGFEI